MTKTKTKTVVKKPSKKMAVNLAHKIELNPNNKQKTYFSKACGISRFAWNWGLDRDLNAAINLERQINFIKKIRSVRPKFKPVEITAMRKSVFPMLVTSIFEAGSEFQAA